MKYTHTYKCVLNNTVFFNTKGIILQKPHHEQRKSITSKYYIECMLSEMNLVYKRARLNTRMRDIQLLYNNAPVHQQKLVQEYLSAGNLFFRIPLMYVKKTCNVVKLYVRQELSKKIATYYILIFPKTLNQIIGKCSFYYSRHFICFWWRLGKKWSRINSLMVEFRQAQILEVSKAYKAINWPTPVLTERTFDSSEFSAEGNSSSASTLPCCGRQI